MGIDTKPNFSCTKFEQCSTDVMNLSGCTQIYGIFDIESGATLSICDNVGAGKVLTSDASGVATWETPAAQGITAISGGSGMSFSPITSTGSVVLGTPSAILNTSTNVSSGTTHHHAFTSSCFISGTQGILVDGSNKFYLDDTYLANQTLPNLYSYSGISANQSIGALPSGQTLGMVYITNTGSTTGYFSLGTTPTGDDITPYQTIQVDPDEDVSVTINMRLSLTANTTIYVSSADWTNVGINLQWANITYQNASTTINPGDLPIASITTLGAIIVGDGLDVDETGILSVTGGTGGGTVTGATNLGTGNGTIYTSLSDMNLQFKTLSGGTDISITCNGNYVGINSTAGGTITGGANGLCTSGANIVLGGVLTGNTSIDVSTFEFDMTGDDVQLFVSQESISAYLTTSYSGIEIEETQAQLYANENMLTIGTGFTCYTSADGAGICYAADYSGGFVARSIPDVAWVTGGTGGFLGTVTDTTAEPSDLRNNQWVKPEPNGSSCFDYTFTNFCDISATPIVVNLSLEDVYLRYHQSGDYWSKESYNKPLSSGYTWMGNTNCEVCEVQVITEWVGDEAALLYAGQKYPLPTQTISVTDVATCTISPNYVITQNIPMNVSGNTAVFTIPTGCAAIINSAKLIFLQAANPTSICVAMGNNSCATPALSYDNLVSCVQIDNLVLNETYSLTPLQQGVTAASGSIVYFRVGNATTCDLCAHLLIEGFLY